MSTVREVVQGYVRRGWMPVPIPSKEKCPLILGWPSLRIAECDVPTYFNAGDNVGLLLGEPSGGLVDVDLDAPEAIALARQFLPATKRKHGRKSKRTSHWWYVTNPVSHYKKFNDVDGICLLELRSTGHQTMVPPSVHPEGECVLWEADGDPAKIDGAALLTQTARLAAAVLVTRHWPQLGSRHETALALAGFLLRGHWTEDNAVAFVSAVAAAAGDEEWRAREADVHSTSRRLAQDKNATGGHRLSELLGEAVVHRLREWLELGEDGCQSEAVARLSTSSSTAEIEHAIKLVASVESPIERERILKLVAGRTKLPLSLLRKLTAHPQAPEAGDSETPIPMSEPEKEEALGLLRSSTLLQEFLSDCGRLGCVGQESEKIALKLAATSGRVSDNPINITIKGESSAGKNHLLNSVLQTEPPESVLDITRMTGKALQYMQIPLKHKIVAIAEVPGAEDADYSIRTMQSEKKIRIMAVEKDASGRLVTKEHTVEGPAVFFQTTTKTHLHVENETRMFDMFVDESEEQTERIFAAQNTAYTNPMEPAERDAILRRWHNGARLLEALPVLIPFVPRIRLPNKPLRVRRDRPRVLALVEASALLHQHQRDKLEKNGRQYLVASVEDYAIARELAMTLLQSVLTGATSKCRRLVSWAEERGQIKFSKKEAEFALDWSRKTVLKYLREAIDLGCIGMESAKVTTASEFWFVKNIPAPALTLPTPEDLAGWRSIAPRSEVSETLSVT